MTNILSRYVLKHFALTFFATLFILVSVIMLFDVVELLRDASKEENIKFMDVMVLALLKSPQMIHIIIPFVSLLAGLVFIFRFDKSSELVVMRAVGLSAWNFITPILVFIFIIGIFDVTVLNPIASITSRRFDRMEERLGMGNSTPFSWSSEGFWLRDVRSDKVLVIRAARVRQEHRQVLLDNVSVFEFTNEDQFLRQNESSVGYLDDGMLTLKDAFVIDPETEEGHTVTQIMFDTDLSLDRILEKFDDPQTMSFWKFPQLIRFLKDSGFNTVMHEMYYNELIAFPSVLVAMLLISAVFALPPSSRQGKTLMRVLLAVLSGFILYFLTRLTNVLGQSESMPLILAAWGPAVIAIILCVSALLRWEDG